MRSNILSILSGMSVAGFGVSQQQPFDQNGTPLYMQNFKKLYVGEPQVDQEPLLDTLDGLSIVNETITVPIYVATDAKTTPQTYNDLTAYIKSVKADSTITGYTQRLTSVSVEYENDAMITQFNLTFTKIDT